MIENYQEMKDKFYINITILTYIKKINYDIKGGALEKSAKKARPFWHFWA